MEIDIEIFGYDEMRDLFASLPEEFQGRVVRSAVGAGTRVVRDKARQNLIANESIRTGLLFRALATLVRWYKRTRTIWGGVGVDRRVRGIYQDEEVIPSKYAHLVEFTPGKSFLRKALDNNQTLISRRMSKIIERGLAREIARLRKRPTKTRLR